MEKVLTQHIGTPKLWKLETYRSLGGYQTLEKALREYKPEEIVAKLEEYDAQTGFHYDEAAAIAIVLLLLSLVLLLAINLLERWSKRHVSA